jgi:hypothetical protein
LRGSLGWRRRQWAVRGPEGGTMRDGGFAMVELMEV